MIGSRLFTASPELDVFGPEGAKFTELARDQEPLLQMSACPRSTYRWVAVNGCGVIVPHGQRLEVASNIEDSNVVLLYLERADHRLFYELQASANAEGDRPFFFSVYRA